MRSYGYYGVLQRLREQVEMADNALEFGQVQQAEQLRALARSVREVAVTLGLTLEALDAAGVLDANKLHERVTAELTASAANPQVTCIQCGKTVPQNQTTITAVGTVCDACAAR